MASWRDVAAQVLSDKTEEKQRALVPSPVQSAIGNGLVQLERGRTPRGCREDEWRRIVADAKRLARDGWAEQALALGWSMLDLFGIGPEGDAELSGLAVWLQSRSIVLLDGERAITKDGDARGCFNRGGLGHGKQPSVAPVLLWDWPGIPLRQWRLTPSR